jgi:superfamily II DNA or RNA helicase
MAGPGLVPPSEARELLAAASGLAAGLELLPRARPALIGAVRQAHDGLRRRIGAQQVAALPVERLRDVTARLPVAALRAAGLVTVADVAAQSADDLDQVPGIGTATADAVIAAAREVADAILGSVRTRIQLDPSEPTGTALVTALYSVLTVDSAAALSTGAFAQDLRAALGAASGAGHRLTWFFSSGATKAGVVAALGHLAALLQSPPGEAASAAVESARLVIGVNTGSRGIGDGRADDHGAGSELARRAWADFAARASDYYALLDQIVAQPSNVEAAHGFLPEDIVAQVQAMELDTRYLNVTLRGYQAFGAKFALVQQRVILGDEMGLGKTIQALAAAAHLMAGGATRVLVVCPASVLINWVREIGLRTTMAAHRVHGDDRDEALAQWIAQGGIAVTTYDSVQRIDVPPTVIISMLIVDEAHYIKNPGAARSKAVAGWTQRIGRVLLMTGTPMENRVEEFRELVSLVNPAVLGAIGGAVAIAGPDAFRQQVATVYLRRNQEDVLTELPELTEIDEWVEFSREDFAAYRTAVQDGNFAAMRRAAYAADAAHSAKLDRLLDIVEDAAENGRKVLIFSFFLNVIAAVDAAIPIAADGLRSGSAVFGPITGATPPEGRQRIVDDFSAAPGHAVLIGQIQASGVGVNLQAASVVVLCEPQVKPTTEDQAIARAHRMGQVLPVTVHRLLAKDSVDQRMLEILGVKQRLFDDYARRSDLAESSIDAVDATEVRKVASIGAASEAREVSEASLSAQVVAQEQQRLAPAIQVPPAREPSP